MNIRDTTKLGKLREKSKILEPMVRIGKSGLSEGIIDEIKIQLKKKNIIKIKLLRACLEGNDKKKIAKELALKADALLIDQVGFIVVLKKK